MIYLVLFMLILASAGFIFILCKGTNSKITNEAKSAVCSNSGIDSSIDYDSYVMSKNEKITYFIIASVFLCAISYVFYRSIYVSLILIPVSLFYIPFKKKQIIKKRKGQLNIQFKELLYAVSSSLTAGKSIENAFKDSQKDILILFPDKKTFIVRELEYINRKIDMNETIESALESLAKRAHLEDIRNFVDVFKTCKRAGGNLVQVIRNTSDIISDKISTKQEISAMLAQRKFEQKILNILPIGMIFLISSSSPEFMEPIYTQVSGRIVMTIALILLAAAYFISGKIMDIEV